MSIVSALFKIQSTQVFPRTFRQIRRIPANCNPAGREPPPLAPPLGELAAPLGAPLRGRHAAKKTVFPSLWYPLSQPDGCQLSQRESQEALPYLPAKLQFILWWNESSEIYKIIESFWGKCKGLADCKENVKKQLQCAARLGILVYHGKIWDI